MKVDDQTGTKPMFRSRSLNFEKEAEEVGKTP